MQQTKTYKLNLIEPSDPFLPDALNANTQRVEDVLIDRMEGSLDAMDVRVKVLEGHKFVYGLYTGNGSTKDRVHVTLGFPPKVVLYNVNAPLNSNGIPMMSARTESGYSNPYLPLTDTGFEIVSFTSGNFTFIAFG